jgi:lipopolysaccharide export system protein LptA
MPESQPQNLKKFHFRAKLPKVFRIGAILVVATVIIVIGIGFYRSNKNPGFRMTGFPTTLSKDVTAVIDNFERREIEGDVLKYYIKADKAITFTDNHQELENVYLEVYDETGEKHDTITAQKGVYIPLENKNFKGYFAGGVNVVTRDALTIKTEQVTYTKETETAEAEEVVEFSREGVVGKATGAVVKIAEKKLELLKDVDIQTYDSPELAKANVRQAHIVAGYASVDQEKERIDLDHGVAINIISTTTNAPRETDIHSDRAAVFFGGTGAGENRKLKKVELFENVKIDTKETNAQPTHINSGYALYDKEQDRFDLKNGVNIVTTQSDKQTNIKSAEAVYEQGNAKIFLYGGAEVTQATDYLKGDQIIAELYPGRSMKSSVVKGNAYLKQVTPERTVEINSGELNAAFNENQKLMAANAIGMSTAVLIPVLQATDYSKVTMTAPNAIRTKFKGEGLLEGMQTEGRTTINLSVPDNSQDAANKRVTADTVKTFFGADGKDIQRAEAVGNAELFVDPLRATAENYKTTINAPRFDCEFFPTGNNAKTCVAATKTKTVRVPTVARDGHGNQTLIADKLSAFFNQQTKDVERFEASGSTKFTEIDRNAIASTITFTAGDEVVKLRGAPTVWDLQGRAKAAEIDWDTKNRKSYLRGGVSTTYYSQKQTGGATPFGSSDKPVFVTAQTGEFDHTRETGTYSGNARAWQENNYVRADRFLIQQKEGQFHAEGSVQSLIYDAKRKEKNKEVQVPVYASSNKMFYNRDNRQIRYDENVDIRQGTDRIVSGTAIVYLDDKNEVSKTVAESAVVITQPNRRATGDYAQYTASDEMVILRGSPARVEDAENGSSESSQITVYMRENRVIGENKPKAAGTPGRTRSVYKVKNANVLN